MTGKGNIDSENMAVAIANGDPALLLGT